MNSTEFKHIGKRIGAKILMAIICIALICSSISAFAMTAIDDADKLGHGNNGDGKYYSSFTSNEELSAVTKATNIELASEGAILLKNGGGEDGSQDKLPYKDIKNISLFGINSDAYGYGGTGSGSGQLAEGGDIYSSFENAGIAINPSLKALYKKHSGGSLSMVATYTTPTYEDKELPMSYYTPALQATYDRYSDAAFIVISRLGGEGTDLARKNVENRVKEENGELVADKDEHYLELSYNEKALIKHVESKFEKVVILFNSGNIIEFGDLEKDPKIDAIVHVGQTGDFGFDGILNVIKGEVSPSGRTVDIYPSDFTVDPTYQNFGDGSQTKPLTAQGGRQANYAYSWKETEEAKATSGGTNMVEYEEGIYLGYKYYETMHAEIAAGHVDLTTNTAKAVLESKREESDAKNYTGADNTAKADDWYGKNVVYPFGYGLSYTDFTWSEFSVDKGTGDVSQDTEFTATVKVANNGPVAGKDVVEIYMEAPYTSGGIEKAKVSLVGFAKTPLIKPSESATVTIKFDAYDIASYDYSDANKNSFVGYEVEAGPYTFYARKNSHTDGVNTPVTINVATGIQLDKSQATGVEVKNVFIDSPDDKAVYNFTSISPTMTIMSRSNMIGTFPKAPTDEELTLKGYGDGLKINPLATGKDYHITQKEMHDKIVFGFILGRDDDTHEIWNNKDVNIPDTWTQAANEKAAVTIRLAEMMGIDPYSSDVVQSKNEALNGKTGIKAWEAFMNQLTYEELKLLNSTGFFKTAEIERVGKEEGCDPDGPCCIGGQTKDGYISARGPSGTRYWCAAQMQAATWNLEFLHNLGVLIGEEGMWNGYNGWYAPSMNTHRSPFSGRNFEYYSQDGVHGGLVAGAVISGVSSRGIYPYIKHFALNDQETSRNNIATWADEQTIRENILRPYQYAVVQGGASAVMTGFNRIGVVACSENYPLLTQILRKEWGFKGSVVTDYQVGTVGDTLNNLEIMTRSGNNIPLGDRAANARGGGQWDPALRNGKGGVKVGKVTMKQSTDQSGNVIWVPSYSTTEFLTSDDTAGNGAELMKIQYYYARTRAMELLYTHVRSNAIDNGADFQKNFAAQTITLPANASGTRTINATFAAGSDVSYELVESNLPEGVRFNINNLTFTSNKAQFGSGFVKIKASYDGWANKTVKFDVKVVEPVTYTGSLTLAKDTAYEATVSQDFWAPTPNLGANQAGTVSVTPSVTGLPAGLTFDAATGKISGTPTAGGEYKVTVTYAVVTRTISSNRPTDSTARYSSTFTLTVGNVVTVTVNGVAQKIESGSKLTKPADPEAPEGQRFVGWYVGDDAFDFDTAITADTVITAKFEAIPDSIEFRVENGEIQAKINGGEWVKVANVSDLKGDKGDPGDPGAPAPAPEGGCGSFVGTTSIVLVAVLGLAFVGFAIAKAAKCKKED